MGGLLVILFICLILGLIGFTKSRNLKNRANTLEASMSVVGLHILGIQNTPAQTLTSLFLCPEKIVIEAKGAKFELPLERLNAAIAKTHTELVQQQKSVAGRALIGGVLLGPIGAIVGGMTGIGKKNKKGNYLILNFTSQTGETESMVFWCGNMSVAKRFADQATAKILQSNMRDGAVQL